MLRNKKRGFKRKRSSKKRPGLKRQKGAGPLRLGKYRNADRSHTTTSVIRAPSGVADRTFVKLKLHIDVTYTNTGGAPASAIFKANSAFDPTGTVGATQPYMYDQWATLYAKYRVHGIGWRCQPSIGSTGVTSTSVRELIVCPTRQAGAFATTSLMAQQAGAKSHRWQINGSGSDNTINSQTEGYFQMAAIAGMTKSIYASDDTVSALVSADPALLIYLHFTTYDPVGVADVTTTAAIDIVQYIEFFERAIPAVS